ncbi:MAG TPA: sphingomyelin phosphodiesterase [Cyclobacteriaceae bacterium]|nr:sphingomyelin phosphodiesterase [Cyclobacteriaceae bacterium]
MKALILVLTSIFFAPVAQSQSAGGEKIKILSWNIYMLPGVFGSGNVLRAEAIGRLLNPGEYDVIVFQEAFDQRARKVISRLLKDTYPYQVGPANQKLFSVKTNSGLWIFSRYPISESHSIVFQTRHGLDALSRKGALLAELNVNGNHIQIVATHLQNSGETWRKQSQCSEIYSNLLKKYQRTGIPQIVCGDFNINRHITSVDYQLMLKTLDVVDCNSEMKDAYSYDRIANDLHVERGTNRDLIDYILIRNNLSFTDSNNGNIRVFQKQWNNTHKDLSDHYSLETEVTFRNLAEGFTVAAPR